MSEPRTIDDELVAKWVAAAATASLPPADADAGTVDVVVAYEVDDGPAWWVGVRDGAAVAGVGRPDRAHVTLRCSADAAADLAGGSLDVQRAVADGRVRVAGDVRVLVGIRPALRAIAEATATVVGSTT